MHKIENAGSSGAGKPRNQSEWLCTKQVAALTGYSASYFEKGRVYGYGPPYYKPRGKVTYRRSEVEAWLEVQRVNPEGVANV